MTVVAQPFAVIACGLLTTGVVFFGLESAREAAQRVARAESAAAQIRREARGER